MVKWFQVIFFSVLVLGCSCESSNEVDVLVVDELEIVPFDELAYLESKNSNDFIYMGTYTQKSILKDSLIVDYEKSYNKDYLNDLYIPGFDSVFYNLEQDSLLIFNVVFKKGSCDIRFQPYLSFYDNYCVFNAPELLEAEKVEISDSDTSIYLDGCSMAGSFEFKYKIPLSKLENTDHLYFKGQEIIFK